MSDLFPPFNAKYQPTKSNVKTNRNILGTEKEKKLAITCLHKCAHPFIMGHVTELRVNSCHQVSDAD